MFAQESSAKARQEQRQRRPPNHFTTAPGPSLSPGHQTFAGLLERGGFFYKQEAMTDKDKDRILAAYERTGLCKTIRTADRIAATAQALGLPAELVAEVVGGEE